LSEHEFQVRGGSHDLTQAEWAVVVDELHAWYPACHLALDVQGEMGPFGVRVATAVTITLCDGPESRSACVSLLRRALSRARRPDLLVLEIGAP
jgi:hypothetical protein